MITQEDRRKFFATKKGVIHTINMKGQLLKLKNFPEDKRKEILDKLVEKDPILGEGQKGVLPGLKIDGKQVTRDNIHEFELKPKGKAKTKVKIEEDSKKYTKEGLESLSFSKLKKIAKEFGQTGRSKKGLIKDILKFQK